MKTKDVMPVVNCTAGFILVFDPILGPIVLQNQTMVLDNTLLTLNNCACYAMAMGEPRQVPFAGELRKYAILTLDLNEWEISTKEMPPGVIGLQKITDNQPLMALWHHTATKEETWVVMRRLHRQFQTTLPIS